MKAGGGSGERSDGREVMAARSGGRVDGGQWQRLAVCLAEGGRHVRLERPWSRRPGAGGWSGMRRRSGERRPGKGKAATEECGKCAI